MVPRSMWYADYNEVIYYMNDHLNRPKIVSWMIRMKSNVVGSFVQLYKRFKTSSQMFMRTWKQRSTDIRYIDMDDDIPF